MESKIFYRVANHETQQGLWYDFNGKYTGNIHDKFSFCCNNKLPMPFDPNLVGWLSTTDTLDALFHWFTKEDILNLEKYGYTIALYESTDYKSHLNHWIISQETSKLVKTILIADI